MGPRRNFCKGAVKLVPFLPSLPFLPVIVSPFIIPLSTLPFSPRCETTPNPVMGTMESAVSSPSEVQGRAPTANAFRYILSRRNVSRGNDLGFLCKPKYRTLHFQGELAPFPLPVGVHDWPAIRHSLLIQKLGECK